MTTIYQLKVEIAESQPLIWRRIQVESDITFEELHDTIQIAFGWSNEHDYEFTINKTRIYDFGPELDMGDDHGERDSVGTVLDEYLNIVNTRFKYVYDFESRWEHSIVLEQILTGDDVNVKHSACIAGEGACPPEGCRGILDYQNMLSVLSDKNHPQHKFIKKLMGENWSAKSFDIEKVNDLLQQYVREWEEIQEETGEIIDRMEGKENSDEDWDEDDFPEDIPDDFDFEGGLDENEYESLKHLSSPGDLLEDKLEKKHLEYWMKDALDDKNSGEYKALRRLTDLGYDDKKVHSMVMDCLAVEWFYDLKYGTDHLDERFDHNLERLPEKPLEIPTLEHAIGVLDKTIKGIPFQAIEYLHNDPSSAATLAIINALKNVVDHQYHWGDCTAAPIWYAMAAEGHLCEELIDPVIGLCERHENESDWLLEQTGYLIGKLAQSYPDQTASKVLDAMEKDAEAGTEHWMFYLFDVFHFCDIGKYKQRLLALLERDDLSWHDSLASTLACLQVKEALPILKRQLEEYKSDENQESYFLADMEQAIKQLETGENLYPDVNTPICLQRTTTWKEELEGNEELFYYDDDPFDEFDSPGDFSSPQLSSSFFGLPNKPGTVVKEKKPGRNDPCPCGSGKKYKKCCLNKDMD